MPSIAALNPEIDPELEAVVRKALARDANDRYQSAAQLAAEKAARQAQEHGLQKVDVFVKGPGSGRETAIRSLAAAGLEVAGIQDVTPVPHNGCRPRKRRRV